MGKDKRGGKFQKNKKNHYSNKIGGHAFAHKDNDQGF